MYYLIHKVSVHGTENNIYYAVCDNYIVAQEINKLIEDDSIIMELPSAFPSRQGWVTVMFDYGIAVNLVSRPKWLQSYTQTNNYTYIEFPLNKYTIQCQCCFDEYPLHTRVKYKIVSNTEDWKFGIYCQTCTAYIHKNRWDILKDGLRSVGCLAEFKNVVKLGLPITLIERDISNETDSWKPIVQLLYSNGDTRTSKSTVLEADLSIKQRDLLVAELRALDAEQVTDNDIHRITSKYWP